MGPVTALRDLLSVLLLLGALVLGAAWLPAVWFEQNVVDQEGFLAVTQPLADDPAFRTTLTDSAVEQLLADDAVPSWIQESLTPLAQDQASRLAGTDAYAGMWDETMLQLHGALFTPGGAPVDVDLAPGIDAILDGVETHLPITLPRPDSASVTLFTVPDVPFLHHATVLDPWAQRLGPIALGMALLALLIGGHRRGLLLLAGIAAAAAGALDCLLASRIEQVVPDAVDQAAFLGPLVQVFEGRFADQLPAQAVVLMGAGALVAVAGLVLLGLRRRPVR
ncbi:hypothetical protein GCM10028787_23330 [Brachybacterium horti]